MRCAFVPRIVPSRWSLNYQLVQTRDTICFITYASESLSRFIGVTRATSVQGLFVQRANNGYLRAGNPATGPCSELDPFRALLHDVISVDHCIALIGDSLYLLTRHILLVSLFPYTS
jgi:hypothetical protein